MTTPRYRYRLTMQQQQGAEVIALSVDKTALDDFAAQCLGIGCTFLSCVREDNPIRERVMSMTPAVTP